MAKRRATKIRELDRILGDKFRRANMVWSDSGRQVQHYQMIDSDLSIPVILVRRLSAWPAGTHVRFEPGDEAFPLVLTCVNRCERRSRVAFTRDLLEAEYDE